MGDTDSNVGHTDGWPALARSDRPLTIDLTDSGLVPKEAAVQSSTHRNQVHGAPSVALSSAATGVAVDPAGSAAPRPSAPTLPEPGAAPVPVPSHSARSRRREDWLASYGVQPLLVACDLAAALAGGVLTGALTGNGVGRVHLVFAVVLVSLFTLAHLYRSRLSMSLLDDVPQIVGRWLAAVALTILVQAAFTQLRWDLVAVKWEVVAASATTLVLLLLFRSIGYGVVRSLRRQRRVVHRTLILGAGRVGAQVADVLLDHPEYGLHPIGFLDSDPWLGPKELPLPILGGTDALYHVLTDHGVNNVVVAFGSMRESALVDVIRTCDRLDTEIFIVPRLFELHHVSEDMDTVWGMPLVRLRRAARRSRGWQVKRVFDVLVSSVALILLSPIMLLTALAVRLEGGPGIIFRQERVGVDGRRFQVMKFRSLKPVDDTESQTNWNISHDDRLGPVGKFLRKSSIDELPAADQHPQG